jgi:hypothetical protein
VIDAMVSAPLFKGAPLENRGGLPPELYGPPYTLGSAATAALGVESEFGQGHGTRLALADQGYIGDATPMPHDADLGDAGRPHAAGHPAREPKSTDENIQRSKSRTTEVNRAPWDLQGGWEGKGEGAGAAESAGIAGESLQAQMRSLLMTLQDFSSNDLTELLRLGDTELEKVLLLLLDRSDLEEDPDDEVRVFFIFEWTCECACGGRSQHDSDSMVLFSSATVSYAGPQPP